MNLAPNARDERRVCLNCEKCVPASCGIGDFTHRRPGSLWLRSDNGHGRPAGRGFSGRKFGGRIRGNMCGEPSADVWLAP